VRADVFDAVRSASAQVMERADSVRIDEVGLAALAEELGDRVRDAPRAPGLDPAHHHLGDADATLAFIFTLDAVNFGSGYFPFLAKRPGLSGYLTIATNLRQRFESQGPWSAAELAELRAGDCAAVLGQDHGVPEVAELMGLFAKALNDLGRFLAKRYEGRFENAVETAAGSAAALVADLARMSFYRDVARYGDLDVPFYKRAQITVSDLALAFQGRGWGAFRDIDRLTIFADNLVPHVLRWKGVLLYSDDLARRVDAGQLLPAGSREEVEIRAGAVRAVELCVRRMNERGVAVTESRIDTLLWTIGQRPEMKLHPRHRTRCTYY
jgi:hypothetical protein